MDCNNNNLGDITPTAAYHTYTQKCGRCPAVIEYDARTDWSTVSKLVNEHWATCPSRLSLYGPCPSHPPPESYITQNASNPRQDSTGSLGADEGNHDDQVIAGCSKQRKTEAERKKELENDEYAYNVQPISVNCRGCEKEISLDKRSRYYPGLWTKHRRKCPGIQRMEKGKLVRNDSLCAMDAELRPKAASLFETSNHRADGIACAAAATFMEQGALQEIDDNDSEFEEDQDHIPFSTLNKQYYNECRERGERWTYRYASRQEIMEQVFHDEVGS
ncbi:hypothetical protein AZE42_04368 [Rhizopogon vesiculosus]|uniref:Uncharacterized protein n=1 Tax=Rhizopogon vesiculosus TaxID=180088 RepID=A0A1J8QYZ6_9AGAM|nr:hypothetical protein AZE42_04368 [Rhizopogon vesiculosus]